MDFNAEALQRVQIVLQQRGDGFHQRAGDMALLVGQRQSVDDAAGVRIGLRRNGSRAMREDDQSVTARRNLRRQFIQLLVVETVAEIIAEMAEEHAGGRRPRQEDVALRREAVVGSQLPRFVIEQFGQRRAGGQRAAGRLRDDARPAARAKASRHMVQRADGYRRVHREAAQIACDATACDFARLFQRRQLRL